MPAVKQKIPNSTELLLRKAEEFHGHLGSFLVIGVRMGQIGLEALDAKEHKNSLHVSLKVPPNVPYSCIVDRDQISTRCTIGNQKLQLRTRKKSKQNLEI